MRSGNKALLREKDSFWGGLMSADIIPDPPHLVFHLVNVLFYFLIFDSFLFDLIGQLGDRESGVYASCVLQKGLVNESVLALHTLLYVDFKCA